MTNPSPENSKSPAEELRAKRHRLAAESGNEHFPSDLRYDIAMDSLERALGSNPGKGILDMMDGLAGLYEYQHLIREDPKYRHPETLDNVERSLDSARTAVISIDGKLSPVDRHLASVTLSLTVAQEYLRRFHVSQVDQEKNFGLSQYHVRMAIERAIKAFTSSPE